MSLDPSRLKVQTGDRAPVSYGMLNDQSFYSFDAQAGRTAVLLFAGTLPPSAMAPFVTAFQQRASEFLQRQADLVMLVDALGEHVMSYVEAPPEHVKAVYCMPEILQNWAFDSSRPCIVVMDRNTRIVAPIYATAPELAVQMALAYAASCPQDGPRDEPMPAPVLSVPNIFSAEFCQDLIDHFERSDKMASGMASIDADGNPYYKMDETKKKRQDCVLRPGDTLYDPVIDALKRSCVVEIKRAYQFDITCFDRIILARYDHTGGYFLRHRDNFAPSVAFRQFALSVNLNTGEYEGGNLLFPEFNSYRYKPARGGGLAFSATLLHEATPVTAGSRYALLTFMHNDEAEAKRLAFKNQMATAH